jgi:hypothetical protein
MPLPLEVPPTTWRLAVVAMEIDAVRAEEAAQHGSVLKN